MDKQGSDSHPKAKISQVNVTLPQMFFQENKSINSYQRITQSHSQLSTNIYLTNSIGYKPTSDLIFPKGHKLRLLTQGWIVISGKIKIVSKLNKSFEATQGFIWFQSLQLRQQIKQVETLTIVVLKKINYRGNAYQNVQNYYKQVKDILYQNPYFGTWTLKSVLDIAVCSSCLKMQSTKKIYETNDNPDYFYIIKSGQVELVRSSSITNGLFESYQMDFEQVLNSLTQNRVIIPYGNTFGLDGIFIKQGTKRVYTANVLTDVELFRIPGSLLSTVYQLFETHTEARYIKKVRQNFQQGGTLILKQYKDGIINKNNSKKRQFVKLIKQYQTHVRMKSVSNRISKSKPCFYQKPQDPFKATQPHKQFYKQQSKARFTSLIPNIKNTKTYIGFLQQKITQRQHQKQHQNYKKKVQQQILKANRQKRQTKSTLCFRIKPYSLQKRQYEKDLIRKKTSNNPQVHNK